MGPCDMPPRPESGHKGLFGIVGIVGGQDSNTATMVGAPALAGRAALRSGCGRVMIAAPHSITGEVLSGCLSATGHPLPQCASGELDSLGAVELVQQLDALAEAMAIGPGLGQSDGAASVLSALLNSGTTPLVVDADGIHLFAKGGATRTADRPVVLTPHPGEFRVIASVLGIPAPEGEAERVAAAVAAADARRCTVVLKGHHTVVASEGAHWTCDLGGVELAVPGSGDVLTGVLAGLLAQGGDQASVAELACLAVQMHAEAGAAWRAKHGSRGLLAEELADLVGCTR